MFKALMDRANAEAGRPGYTVRVRLADGSDFEGAMTAAGDGWGSMQLWWVYPAHNSDGPGPRGVPLLRDYTGKDDRPEVFINERYVVTAEIRW